MEQHPFDLFDFASSSTCQCGLDKLPIDHHLHKFFELSLDLFCMANGEGFFVEVNPAFTRTLGWSRAELLSHPFIAFVHAEDVGKTLAEIEKLNLGQPTISFENRYRCASGDYRYLMWNAFPDPVTGLFYAAARDTTAQKLTEKQVYDLADNLQHKIEQFHELVGTGIDILRIDDEATLIDLALRRATALTDARHGTLRIVSPDGRLNEISVSQDENGSGSAPGGNGASSAAGHGVLAGDGGSAFNADPDALYSSGGATASISRRTSAGSGGMTAGALPVPDASAGSPEAGASGGLEEFIESGFICLDHEYTLTVSGKMNGHAPAAFETVDKMLLHLISQQVRTSIENKYYIHEVIEKQRMTRELELAATLQKTILPAQMPEIPGYRCGGLNIPSKEVGGDYYEIIPLPDGRQAMIIADVAGKGFYSALLVNSLHAALHAYLESSLPLAVMAQRLNQLIYDTTTAILFITCFIAILDPESGAVEYMNAGHLSPMVVRHGGSIEVPEVGGPPLGCVREAIPYQVGTFRLEPGDGLLFFTDGITEAVDESGQFYQKSGRLEKLVLEMNRNAAACQLHRIVEDVRDFSHADPFEDDITLLFLHREG